MWPFVDGFAQFLAMMVVLEMVGTAADAAGARTPSTSSPARSGCESLAFMRAALNIGFTIGALIGGLASGHQQRRGRPGGARSPR